MHVSDVEFSNREGNRILNLSPDVQTMFSTWDLEVTEKHEEDHIWVSHVARDMGMQSCHTALVRLLDWAKPTDAKMSWRREAGKEKLSTIEGIRTAMKTAIDEKIVQYVMGQRPHSMPFFE